MNASAFIDLCKGGTPKEIEAAIKAGADVNAKASDGKTPLNLAAKKNGPEVLSLLLEAGASVSKDDLQLAEGNEKLKDTDVYEELKKRAR